MSLINDALKKAQLKRAEDPAPAAPPAAPGGGTPPVQPSAAPLAGQPAKPRVSSVRYDPYGQQGRTEEPKSSGSGGQKIFWLSLAVIAAAAIIVRLTVTFSRAPAAKPVVSAGPATSPAIPVATTPAPVAATPIAEPSPTPITPTPVLTPAAEPAETKAITFPAPAVAKTEPASEPVAPKPAAAPLTINSAPAPQAKPEPTAPRAEPTPTVSFPLAPTAETSVTPAPRPPPTVLPPLYAPKAPTPINNSARIQSFIDRIRVAGVRISPNGSKVILNDRLFSAGEVVEPMLELKLAKIEDGVLTFSDQNGKLYLKLFQ